MENIKYIVTEAPVDRIQEIIDKSNQKPLTPEEQETLLKSFADLYEAMGAETVAGKFRKMIKDGFFRRKERKLPAKRDSTSQW